MAATKKPKKPTGRPKKEIDGAAFEKLCGLQCTRPEICHFFDVSDKTLDNWCKETYGKAFSAVFAQKRVSGKISLRRNMFKLAEKNAAVSIFLAKNHLGMKDQPIDEAEIAPAQPVSIIIQVEDASKNPGK